MLLPLALGIAFKTLAKGSKEYLDKALALISMAGIGVIIVVITAAGRDSLLDIGLLLILACLLHNLTGYTLGYWICRLFRMDEKSCRTIALEVGMQNGGLASGIALEMGRVATIGLAPAVFGPMMNITGSSLATYWRDRQGRKK
jgi:BASS family bile acid:Na+ symporter